MEKTFTFIPSEFTLYTVRIIIIMYASERFLKKISHCLQKRGAPNRAEIYKVAIRKVQKDLFLDVIEGV